MRNTSRGLMKCSDFRAWGNGITLLSKETLTFYPFPIEILSCLGELGMGEIRKTWPDWFVCNS